MTHRLPAPAKIRALHALSDSRGIIAAAAVDQRGSLRKMIRDAGGPDPTKAQMTEFKTIITEALAPHASAVLLDPEYSLPVLPHIAPRTGVLLAYEVWGYEQSTPGRLPALLPTWSVRRLVAAGATGIKILLYYDPDEDERINRLKHAFVERVGAECAGCGVPFFLEPLAYSDEVPDEKGSAFAALKPEKVRRIMTEFSDPRYAVDILKVEIPVNLRFVAGTRSGSGNEHVYTRARALQHFRETAAGAHLPFIYLSAAVDAPVFRESLELAAEAGVPFSGILCGRATWQDGVPVYVREGAAALRDWAATIAVQNITALNQILSKAATPWWDTYGGRDAVSVASSTPAPQG